MIAALPMAALLVISPTTALTILAGLGVFTVVIGVYVLSVPPVVERRMAHFVAGAAPAHRPALDLSLGSGDLLGAIDRQLSRRGQGASIRLMLQRANLPISVSEFLAIRVGLGLLVGGIVALLEASNLGWLTLAPGAVVGFVASLVPGIVVSILAKRRVARVEAQLPDALDTIAAALQAGAGLSQAFLVITREMTPPISEEFQRVLQEVEIGLSLNEALGNMATRLGSEDVEIVVTTINIQTRVGGNLVQILRTINSTVRERVRIRGEIQVLTAMQQLSAMVICGVPPGLGVILYLMNPTYVSHLFVPGIGLAMLIASTIMTLLGIVILRKITDIDI